MRALQVRQIKRSSIKVSATADEKRPAANDRVTSVLAMVTLAACSMQITRFQNAWVSDDDSRITREDIVVTVNGVSYEARAIEDMKKWHMMIQRFADIDAAVEWALGITWQPEVISIAKDEPIMEPRQAALRLKMIRVLHADYFLTTFCGKQDIEEECLDRATRRMIRLHRGRCKAISIPANVLSLPHYLPERLPV